MAKILVADDHDDARSVFVSVLRDADHDVVEAADGGASEGDVLQDAWAAGANGTLSKLVDYRFLVSEVERVLREPERGG